MKRDEFFFCYQALLTLWRSRSKAEIESAKLSLQKVRRLYNSMQAPVVE